MVLRLTALALLAAVGVALTWAATHSGGGSVLVEFGSGHGIHLVDALILLSIVPTFALIRFLAHRLER